MKINSHSINDTKIAEIVSDTIVIKTSEDGLDLLGNLYYQDFDKIVIQEKNITPDFFDLKNGMAVHGITYRILVLLVHLEVVIK